MNRPPRLPQLQGRGHQHSRGRHKPTSQHVLSRRRGVAGGQSGRTHWPAASQAAHIGRRPVRPHTLAGGQSRRTHWAARRAAQCAALAAQWAPVLRGGGRLGYAAWPAAPRPHSPLAQGRLHARRLSCTSTHPPGGRARTHAHARIHKRARARGHTHTHTHTHTGTRLHERGGGAVVEEAEKNLRRTLCWYMPTHTHLHTRA